MAILQYISSPETDFSLGIDARSAENQIAPGFVRDLLNADIVEKRVRNRKGYQGFAGNLPVRVTSVEYKLAEQEVCFTLDSAVSLDTAVSLDAVRSSPLVVYGRTNIAPGTGPFSSSADAVKYYSGFSIPTRKTLLAPSGTLAIPANEHGLGTTNMFIDVYESTSVINRSYSLALVDQISINESSFDVSINYNTYIDRDVFVSFVDKSDSSAGTSWVDGPHSVSAGTTSTWSIPAATHNLINRNITCQIQQDIGASRIQVIPDFFLLAPNGDVTISITNGTSSTANYYAILSAAPIGNVVSGVVNANSTGTVTISNASKPWAFFGIYLEQTPGGTKELVLPDTIDYDDVSQTITLTFDNEASLARNFIVYYEFGDVRSNQLCVSDATVTGNAIDDTPQITLWGLDHSEIYTTKQAREGWVNHIDSYRRSGEQRVISGLGGNLFSARTYAESATAYAYAQLYPRLSARTSANSVLGPLFWDTGEVPQRARGYITSDASGSHWATVSSVAYDTGTGWTKYTISLPNKQVLDSTGVPTSLSSVISVTADLEDWLTVQGMSYSRHSGTFRIRQITDGANAITIYVENDTNSADYDDLNTAGLAGVFTDQLTWLSNSLMISGDILQSEVLGSSSTYTVISSVGAVTVSDGLLDKVEVPGGVLFVAERTSPVVPLRSANPTSMSSSSNLVRGDMLSYTGIDRLVRVKYINPDSDRTVNIAVTGGVATATMQSGDTTMLSAGQSILLTQAGKHTGVQYINDITSLTEFTYTTSETSSVTGAQLVGNTMELDESLDWTDTPGDSTVFTVQNRWIPIEAPDDSFDLTPITHTRYFDINQYSDEPFLRSTMIQNGMYLTNYDDEVYKADGSNLYRAGLIPWQPGLFLTQETSGAAIVTDLRSVAYSAKSAAEGKITIAINAENALPIGTSVRLSGSTETYKIISYTNDLTDAYILLDRSLDSGVSASGTASEIGIYRYYFRLNAVDSNSNLIASATTGFEDHVVELTGNAAIQIRLVGLPAWDVYDYDRLECQIYRTKINTAAPFYLVTTLPMSFNNTVGYLDYKDSFTDSDLSQLDIVNTALKGTELGTSWTDPLRAKCITSIGNKLILANIRDYPELDLQIVGAANLANTDFAGDSLLFRRSTADALTTTDMTNRVRYEWINGFTGDVTNPTIGTDTFSFDTSVATGAAPGDWIYLTYSTVATTARDLHYCGWYQIASVSTNTVTVNIVGALAAGSYPDKYTIATNSTDVPVLLGVDGSLGMLNGDSFDTFDAMRRMALAINATMRMVDISLTPTFTPWLVARGGNDLSPAGRLLVRQPRSDQEIPEVVPTFSGYDLFVNQIRRTSGDQISASTRVFPSRIIASYENYPEIFDNPTTILDTDSDSAVDVNPADGQEITCVIPFFGSAAFTAAQQYAVLVVFKTNSIYLVDLNQKTSGGNPVQRIESEGLGCTAPNSVSVTKNGIMFANESGIYRLDKNLMITYIGRYMERKWTELVNLNRLDLAQGHHFGIGRVYKLSIPLTENVTSTGYQENSDVYVYNHTGEDEGKQGAWSRYDNHASTGWANLASDAFFASTGGRVFSIRQTGDIEDYRDDSSSIHFLIDTRPNDFGNAGIRKVVDSVVVHYRSGATSQGTTLSYAQDLEQEYTATTPIVVRAGKLSSSDDVSDQVGHDIVSIRHSLQRRKGLYLNIRIENQSMDESIEIAGIDYRVGGLTDRGILQASQTK